MYGIELPEGKSLHQAGVVGAHCGCVNADIVALLWHACDIAPRSRAWTAATPRSGGSPRAAARAHRSTAPAPPSLQASSLLDVASSCTVRHHQGAGAAPPQRSTSTAWHYDGGLRSGLTGLNLGSIVFLFLIYLLLSVVLILSISIMIFVISW
jgi:hypothetical protein